MTYPIIEVKTKDNLVLHGLISPKQSDSLLINIHGTGSNFFCEAFQEAMYNKLVSIGIDTLFTNNRGSYAMDSWQDTGAALEIFEKSVLDIDSWMKWAIDHEYKKIILSGHSHGTEKVVYYMTHGQYKDRVTAVILMGFADTIGTQANFEKTISVDLMAEAKEKVAASKGYELLTGHRKAQAGELPISADTYLNYFSENSELSKVTPFHNDSSLPMIKSIKVPILATIGDHEEYTIIPIKDAMALLEKENPLVEVHQIVGSGHCYENHENELTNLIEIFLTNNKLLSS
jgi:pimeloyl-ACP methyl ester carboxylesterase